MSEKKRGRPLIEVQKSNKFLLRMDVGDRAMLDYLAEETGLSGAEILRESLKNFYNDYERRRKYRENGY